jgi:hypothetical protein
MFRTLLAITTATLGLTAFATAAQACISCEYVPEVVREHSTFNAKRHRAPSYAAAAKLRVRPAAPVVKAAPRRIETASINARKTETSAAKVNTQTVTPSSVALLKSETGPQTSTEPQATEPGAEAKPVIETASTTAAVAEEPKAEEPKASEPVGCKRFIPAVGVTLSVACD